MDSVSPSPAAALSPEEISSLRRKAGWSAILVGGLGVHKFLLGYNRAGTIMAAIGLIGWIFLALPSVIITIVGVLEGIIYLTKSDEDFAATYVYGRRTWF